MLQPKVKCFVDQRLKELEHPALFTERKTNLDNTAYKVNTEKDTHKPPKKVFTTINTGQRLLNKSLCGFISGCFQFYGK